MKKYKIVTLITFTVLITIAVNTVSAADNTCSRANVCNVVSTHYECNSWSNKQYPVINLFGEKNVPLFANHGNIWNLHVNKLAKLILDSNTTYTLKTGEKLALGQGYALEAKQIDIDNETVWLEFTRDEQYVADQIISVDTDSSKTWNVVLDNVQGENNIVVMKVYVNQLFAGAADNIVRIDGVWLIDYANAKTLKVGDKIGKFTLEKIICGTNSCNLGSLVFENIAESPVSRNVVGTHYECNSWSNEQYPVIDLFGEKSVPLLANNDSIWKCHVNKLARLVLDSNETYTLKTGEKLDLGQGYALEAKQIDIDGNKVWLEFTKDGQYVDDQILSVDTESEKTWTVALDNVQGENNIVVMKVYVSQLFAGAVDNVVRIDGIWLTDYANATTLEIGDKIGKFTLEKIICGTNSSNLGSLVFEKTKKSPVSCNVVDTSYECNSWSNEQYPLINLFGEKSVPLLANNDSIWQSHVDKVARLMVDSNKTYTLQNGEKLDFGNGYVLNVRQIDIDSEKVWLELTKDEQHIADQNLSVNTDDGNKTWTVTLDNVQGENNIVVMKVHVKQLFVGVENCIVFIDGIWLIDYANATTLKTGDKIGGFTLEKIVSGTDSSNLGSLVFEKAQISNYLYYPS